MKTRIQKLVLWLQNAGELYSLSTSATFMQKHICSETYPVGSLKSGQSVNKQNDQMKQYAANLCLAAYASFPVLTQQISAEALGIFKYVLEFYRPIVAGKITLPEIRKVMQDTGMGQQYKHYLQYLSYFSYQGGNYEGFGDIKFIPRLSKEDFVKLETILREKCGGHFANLKMEPQILDAAYDLSKHLNIQFYENGGQTQYYSSSITKDDVMAIDKTIKEWNPDFLFENTTIEETKDAYLMKIAAIEAKQVQTGKTHKNKPIILDYGKFSNDFKVIVKHLKEAINFAANDTQKKMLGELIKFYENGDMKHHLEYSKLWVMDQNPQIETYQGFIETYRDPQGIRAEMEAFVATIDLETSGHLARLLEPKCSAEVLKQLPVPDFLHRETFQTPTYNAIDIVAFVSSGMPIGINIPNYDQIRNVFGFKNVSLQNVINTRLSKSSELQFLGDKALKDRIAPQMVPVMNNNTALHELFGHGSCRTLEKAEHEKLTPEQKKLVPGFYDGGLTYSDVFKEIASQFEECRAQVTAEFLQDTEVCFKAFGVQEKDLKDYRLAFTYDMALVGLLGLMQYDDKGKKWLQAHSRANHLILRNVLNRTDAVKLEITDETINIHVDETRIHEVHEAHGWLINKLNIFKSGADYQGGLDLFNAGTEVDDYWLKVREICIKNKKPRWVYVPAFITKKGDSYALGDLTLDPEDEYAGPSYTWANNSILAGL